MEVRGHIHKIGDTQQVTDSFRKRDLVLKYSDNPMYPQYVLFEFVQDRVSILDNFNPGDEVEVVFDLRGREWTSPQGEVKYFNTLGAYLLRKVETTTVGAPSNPGAAPQQQQSYTNPKSSGTPTPPPAVDPVDGADDDLPF